MSESINSAQNNNKVSAILQSDSDYDRLEGNSRKKIAEVLLKESTNYSNNSNAGAEEARQLLGDAEKLEKLAIAVRVKADQLRKKEIDGKDQTVNAVVNTAASLLEMPIPKNATPELLEKIASSLDEKAKDNRRKADELLKQSEESLRIAKQLEEQAGQISRKEMNLSDLDLKSAQAHNEGLNLVFKKLGIYRLDAEYKEQVAYSQKRAAMEQSRL